MEAVIITIVVALANIVCFLIGVKVGMAVAKYEPIELPKIRAFDYTKNAATEKEQREAEAVRNRVETILRNIEKYDGTSLGQEDVR
jgi:hypothetical protein